MIRSLLALLIAAPIIVAQPPKDGEKALLYFPVKEGTKLVMERSTTGGVAAGQVTEVVDVVKKVEAKDGKFRVTFERESKGKGMQTVYEVSDKGVAKMTAKRKDLAEPAFVLKLPAKKGDTWTAAGVSYTTGEVEEVEVPAGKYKAVPVTSEFDFGDQKVKTTTWFAPEVGIVKTLSVTNGIESKQVLKTFTPAK
jgi:hypothetical protein